MKVWLVIGIGVLMHCVCFFSIFEIYFTSPLVNGMTPHVSPLPPPAKRLVFIVADGLRADKVFSLMPNGKTPAPFLRGIIKEKGIWGVSHAAVPTATRPGHVALTAGFYEDPTSVAKDLQGKPVMFDTVFNESRYTWSWDTPKFLAEVTGGNQNRMFSEKYPGHMKWLAGINAADMDSWVLQEVDKLFQRAKTEKTVSAKMAEDHILFFLHLGGLDHSGYIVRPNSDAYLEHITLVDKGIEKMVTEIENHYNHDGKTAYVFTSDHGMTDWGAHGDGTPAETLTPLIAWGPGLKGPQEEDERYSDGLSEAWDLSKYKRRDIRQASMAAFLSAIVGNPYPMNSVFPVPDELFNVSEREKAEMVYANLRQLLAQYESIRNERQRNSLSWTFTPYYPLLINKVKDIRDTIQMMLNQGRYKEVCDLYLLLQKLFLVTDYIAVASAPIHVLLEFLLPVLCTSFFPCHWLLSHMIIVETMYKEIKDSIGLALSGIRYYQTYDRVNLWIGIVASYVGWMIYILIEIAEEQSDQAAVSQQTQLPRKVQGLIVAFFTLLSVIIFSVLYVQSTLWTNYFYVLMPCPIWMAVCLRLNVLRQTFSLLASLKSVLPYLLLTFAGLELILLGFYYRELMSVVFAGFAAWPWVFKKDQVERRILFQWSASCLTSAFFPLLPSGERELNFNLVVFSGVLVLAVACFLVKSFAAKQLARRKLILVFGFQICVIAISIFIVRHTAFLAATNRRTPLISQALSWIFLGLGVIEPFLVTTDIRCRLLTIGLAWMSPLILFSISYECLFILSMCWNLYVWMVMEANFLNTYMELPSSFKAIENGHGVNRPQENSTKVLESLDFATISNQIANGKSRQYLMRADLRRAYYFNFLVIASLFGTGNIASVNSFDVAAVFCFLSISNPPFMGLLISLKLIIPFILIACAMRAVNLVTHVPVKSFTFLVILLGDIVALQFFLLVGDTGSWIQIGETVSHFVIFQIIHIIIMLLFGFSYILTTCNIGFCNHKK